MVYNFFIGLCLILSSIYGITANISANRTDGCEHQITLQRIKSLLKQYSCVNIKKESDYHRMIPNIYAFSVDMKVLQTIITDHRTLISYLINYLHNNSVNATFVADAIRNHHSKTGPILTSWRDLIHLFFMSIFIGYLIHLWMYHVGFRPCNRCLSFLSKFLFVRFYKRQEFEQQQNL
ncbi:unnamed protein product [Rotaria sordida]|uniref:Uncharacterized protein n=1 Tax=Rotaria sordida TaxID=392033 RepID=A0A816DMU7_9BILA|nr:unnamed protein product [Rotaria sordida]CAF1636717.1 unnamed protein product [Rotaria sordida]